MLLQLSKFCRYKPLGYQRRYSIPVIDFGGLSSRSGVADWKVVGKQLNEALNKIGFAYVKHSKLPEDTIQQTITQGQWLFDQTEFQKNSIRSTSENKYGYYEYVGNPTNTNLIEAYLICHPEKTQFEMKENYFEIAGVMEELQNHFKTQSNRWPKNRVFKETLSDYFFACAAVSQDIFEALAYSLDIDPVYFKNHHSKFDCTLELKQYHPASSSEQFLRIGKGDSIKLPNQTQTDALAVNPHVDLSSITLLTQNQIEGLQIFFEDTWIDAPKLKDCVLVNTGDIMHRWTNNFFSSTIHRVTQNTKDPRLSIVYFCVPNWEARIYCDIPKLKNQPKKYPPILFGDVVPY